MKVLFIAYYFDPYTGVGAKRISYWANEIYKVSNFNISPTVITAGLSCESVIDSYFLEALVVASNSRADQTRSLHFQTSLDNDFLILTIASRA